MEVIVIYMGSGDNIRDHRHVISLLRRIRNCYVGNCTDIDASASVYMEFPRLFKIEPRSFSGQLVGTIPTCFIFVVIIGLALTFYNVRQIPVFIFVFLNTFIPLYVVCFIVAMIFIPIAVKIATAATMTTAG